MLALAEADNKVAELASLVRVGDCDELAEVELGSVADEVTELLADGLVLEEPLCVPNPKKPEVVLEDDMVDEGAGEETFDEIAVNGAIKVLEGVPEIAIGIAKGVVVLTADEGTRAEAADEAPLTALLGARLVAERRDIAGDADAAEGLEDGSPSDAVDAPYDGGSIPDDDGLDEGAIGPGKSPLASNLAAETIRAAMPLCDTLGAAEDRAAVGAMTVDAPVVARLLGRMLPLCAAAVGPV